MRQLTLRTRMVVLATTTVALVLITATLSLGALFRAALVENVTESAVARAQELARLVAQRPLPQTLPVAEFDDVFAQVVVAGEVVATSANVAQRVPVITVEPGAAAVHTVEKVPVPAADAPFVVVAVPTRVNSSAATVIYGASLDDVNETLATATRLALIEVPLVVAVLALVMSALVGRTLRPIEQIRAEAAEISGSDLERRVPQPAGADEVARLASTLNRMLERVENGVAEQRRFVADAAHELRTPVATLRTQLETRAAAGDGDEQLDAMLEETLRMQRLIEQLLVLARLDSSTIQRRPVDVDDVALEAAARADLPPNVHLDVSAVTPVQVTGDATLLGQVAANLLDNATHHARVSVRISTGADDRHAFLQVDDDGPGIPAERRADVVRRFGRLDPSRSRGSGGVGLGLAIVADIIAAHHGELVIADSDLGGAQIVARVPASPGSRNGD